MGEETYRLGTVMGSASDGQLRKDIAQYVAKRFQQIDANSVFEEKLKRLAYPADLIDTDPEAGIEFLLRHNFDGVFLRKNDQFIGDLIFQQHRDTSLHIFAVYIDEAHRNLGLSAPLFKGILTYAREQQIERIRVGAGGNEPIKRMYARIESVADQFNLQLEDNYWVRLKY